VVAAAVVEADDDIVVGIECYQLESVCRLRKYLSFVELGLSFLTSRVVFVSGWSELVKAQVSGHSVQILGSVLRDCHFVTVICHSRTKHIASVLTSIHVNVRHYMNLYI